MSERVWSLSAYYMCVCVRERDETDKSGVQYCVCVRRRSVVVERSDDRETVTYGNVVTDGWKEVESEWYGKREREREREREDTSHPTNHTSSTTEFDQQVRRHPFRFISPLSLSLSLSLFTLSEIVVHDTHDTRLQILSLSCLLLLR